MARKARFAEGQSVKAARHIPGTPFFTGTALTVVTVRVQRGQEARYYVDDSNVYRGWAYESDIEA
jgi:hypothetical protein